MNAAGILGVTWLVFWAYWFLAAFRSKRNASVGSRGAGTRILIFFLVIGMLRFSSHTLKPTQPVQDPYSVAAGFILLALGLGCCIWARHAIGRNWGMPMSQKIDTELVTTGPYRFIRHPIYSGLLVALVGSCLVVGFYWLIIFAAAGTYFVYSAIIEERNLTQHLPSAYPDYKRRTKMFIPFVI